MIKKQNKRKFGTGDWGMENAGIGKRELGKWDRVMWDNNKDMR